MRQAPYWVEHLGDTLTFARVVTAASAALVSQLLALFTHSVSVLIVPPYLVLLLFLGANFVLGASRALMEGRFELLKSTKTAQKLAVYTVTGILIAAVGYLAEGAWGVNPAPFAVTVFYFYAILDEGDSIAENIGGYPVARMAIKSLVEFLKSKIQGDKGGG
jgi:hypothetical protein